MRGHLPSPIMPGSKQPKTTDFSNVQFTNYQPATTVDFSTVRTTSSVTYDTVQFRKLEKPKMSKKKSNK